MTKDSSKIEYADESMKNLTILLVGLGELLRDRDRINDASFTDRVKSADKDPSGLKFLSLPVACIFCGREGFAKLGEASKCLFCGKEIRFRITDPKAKELVSGLDADDLFSFNMKPEYITCDKDLRVLYQSMPMISEWLDLSEDVENRRSALLLNSRIGQERERHLQADLTLQKARMRVNRLILLLKALADTIDCVGPRLLLEYFTIDFWKSEGKYNLLYFPLICSKCGTEQWPSSLLFGSCVSCSEPYEVKLHPGLLLMTHDETSGDHSCKPIKRNLENLYTLFEAIFSCASSTYGITLEDLMHKINETSSTLAFENTKHVCSKCQRQINFSSSPSGSCPYCKGRLFSSFWEQFL